MTRLSGEFRQSLATMAAAYGLALLGEDSSAQAARNYLDGRGLNMQDCSKYGIGLVTGQFDEHASYAGWLCFPYITKLGGVVSLKFRSLHPAGDGDKKYITPYPVRIYNPLALDKADKLGYVAICEGELDALTLDALCDIPAVGIPGVSHWAAHPEWKELFRGYRRVYVFADNDDPGQDLAKAILKEIDTAELVKLPAHDVNDTYRKHGPRVIKERINV
jgi:DNA primase